MRKLRFLMPVGFLLIAALFGLIVMLLWNWLIPSVFGLTHISFWQATGLFILARIFFGGLGLGKKGMMMGHPMHHHKNYIHEKWMNMTPEQQQEFIKRRHKFGFGHPFGRGRFGMEQQEEERNDSE